VIGPGWLPRPMARFRKRTLAYIRPRKRRRKKASALAPRVHHENVLFDRGPVEFPVATLVPRETSARARVLAFGLRRWLAARWSWFRPRMLPTLAAVLGTLLVIESAEYLTHAHGAPIGGHTSCTLSRR
jgi:hypothetical protein